MRYALVGYGKMGRAIDEIARSRGHHRTAIVDPRADDASRAIESATWRGVAVAFEFTEPKAARKNVADLLRRGVRVVCGTTGWDTADTAIGSAARAGRSGAVLAPNFSIGMSLFYAAVEGAARRFLALDDYEAWIAEWHHSAKKDAPSGTARRLAALVGEASSRGTAVPVAAVRAGREPGRHVVGFDGPHDVVTLTHAVRSREGFALGAVRAAEWLVRKRGIHGFDEVVLDLTASRKRRGGQR
jgi:4-hydroxy-tetrahydrodipicolinate reductase